MRAVPIIVEVDCDCSLPSGGRVPCPHPHDDRYAVAGACSNCGQRAIGRFYLRHTVRSGQPCPTCQCATLRWDTSPAPLPAVTRAPHDPIPAVKEFFEQGALPIPQPTTRRKKT